MIDVKRLREDPVGLAANCKRRGCTVDIETLSRLDARYLSLVREVEDMRAERNRLSKLCKTDVEARERVRRLKDDMGAKETQLAAVKSERDGQLAWLPNFLDSSVPDGDGDEDNVLLRKWGEKRAFGFPPRPHDELGEWLGVIDTTRGAKVAQAGFYYWRGQGAVLAQALFFWTQRELVARGFTLFMSPCVAKEATLFGTGYLPFFADQTYGLTGEDLALIGTSEQTLVGYHADETLAADQLPLNYAALTPCFRTEAGSYGKESRGIFRVHQFHKVEQIVFCLPGDSPRCHDLCLENEEALLQALGLPYRVVNVCVGDLGAPGYKKYDIEAWFPGYGDYREVTSNTNLTDFQARRLGIRYQGADKRKGFVHTLSATAVTDRVACAIMENFQTEEGTVVVPEVLRPFTGFDTMEPAG